MLTYRPSVGRYIDRDIGRRSTDTSTDVSVDISTDISTDISRSIHRSSVGRYVNRHIGRVSVDMSTDTSVECRPIYRPIHRSRGAQNTHHPPACVSFSSFAIKHAKSQITTSLNLQIFLCVFFFLSQNFTMSVCHFEAKS